MRGCPSTWRLGRGGAGLAGPPWPVRALNPCGQGLLAVARDQEQVPGGAAGRRPQWPLGLGSAGQSLEPLLGRALEEVPSSVSWCQAEGWDTGLVPGLRGAKERAGGGQGASRALEGHPARQ